MSEQAKKSLIIVIAVVALVAALWSGFRSFSGDREQVVGSLGDLSGGKGQPPAPGGGAQTSPGLEDKNSGGGGAPPEAGGGGSEGR